MAILAALLAAAVLAAGAGASGAEIRIGGLILRADGAYQPETLPRHRFAPIEFEGRVGIAGRGGNPPPVLQQAVIDFDRDGHLDVAGLPTCAPELVAEASTAEARSLCKGAMVGTGLVKALVALPSGTVPTSAPLTFFNGPELGGHPTVVIHARITVPATQTYAIVVPIERLRGPFRYRATIDLPPLAGGLATITGIEAQLGRRFRSGGKRRSYVSARCSDGVLETLGRFTFTDGTFVEGAVEKACTAS